MNGLDLLTDSFSTLSIGEPVPLNIKNIPNLPWYRRLEMAIQLADNLQKLHDSEE